MKIGIRTPSFNKSLAARTSIPRIFRHRFGLKASRGFGWFTNPSRALNNRIYNKTTFNIFQLLKMNALSTLFIKFFLGKNK